MRSTKQAIEDVHTDLKTTQLVGRLTPEVQESVKY